MSMQRTEKPQPKMTMNDINKMRTSKIRPLAIATVLGVAALVAGCGTSTVSKGVTDAGTASEIVFPEISSAWMKEGTFPNLDNLRNVSAGATKGQLYDLLGAPHFAEGIGAVREWDYVFKFRPDSGAGVTVCQYKVLFDKDVLASSFYWKPASCAAVLSKPVMAPAVLASPKVTEPSQPSQRVSIGADGAFRFGKSALADLLPEGRRRIEALGAGIQRDFKSVSGLRITGHTDMLGTAASNDKLSLARALTVRDLLAQSGIPTAVMQARGEGSRRPVVACDARMKRAALVACLQPNRRVEIEVAGER